MFETKDSKDKGYIEQEIHVNNHYKRVAHIAMKVSGFVLLGLQLIAEDGELLADKTWKPHPPMGKWVR